MLRHANYAMMYLSTNYESTGSNQTILANILELVE